MRDVQYDRRPAANACDPHLLAIIVDERVAFMIGLRISRPIRLGVTAIGLVPALGSLAAEKRS
jgi:hypothetical protein